MYTYDTSDTDARFLVRSYFTGDGQHWTAIFDKQTGEYVSEEGGGYPALFRTCAEAVTFGKERLPDFRHKQYQVDKAAF